MTEDAIDAVGLYGGIRKPTEILDRSSPELFAASIAEYYGEEFDVYNYTLIRQHAFLSEDGLYNDYERSYTVNPFAHYLVNSVVNEVIGDGYHFEGAGAKEVDEFFLLDNTYQKLYLTLKNSIKLGNGIMDTGKKSGKTVATRVLDPKQITVTIETDIKKKDYGLRTYGQGQDKIKAEQIFHLIMIEEPGVALGMSMMRPNLIFLQSLYDCGGDVFSAIKRISYAPIVAKLDLEGYRTVTEKREALEKFRDNMKKMQSATNNFVIDKKNDMQLMGAGGAGARLLPTEDLISPWMSIVLINFGMPLGIFLQQGANKAIVKEQMQYTRKMFNSLRTTFKREVETKLIPKITTGECKLVYNKPPPSTEDTREEMKLFIEAYAQGLISKEYFLEIFDIIDTGKTFLDPNKMAMPQNGNKPKSEKESVE